MGMRRRKCKQCGKWRPFPEGSSPDDAQRRAKLWFVHDHALVCVHCVSRLSLEATPFERGQPT